MQKLTLAAIGAACLFATPVLAQTASSNTGTSNNSSSSQPAMSQADIQRVQQKITHDLTSDGYTNVQVVPNSFLVHATDKRNQPVVMIINPDSVFAVTELPNKQANNAGNPNGGSSHNSSLGSSTTTHQ